jgi:hypothetical protein
MATWGITKRRKTMDSRNKKILVVALILVGVGTLSGGVYYTWLITPPGPPKTAQEAMKTIGSARYERMPEYRKQEYLEQAQKLFHEMPEDQRRALWQNGEQNPAVHQAMREMHENAMNKRMEDFAKATPEQRTKMLDEIIDQMEKGGRGRGPWGGRPGGPGAGPGSPPGPQAAGANPQGHRPGGPGHRHDPGRMKNRIKRMAEQGNPQRAALRTEFFRAIQERRKQRGLPPMTGPGPRRH